MNIETQLSNKINLTDIKMLTALFHGQPEQRDRLWQTAQSNDRKLSANALWVMTHLKQSEAEWLASLRNEIIDLLLCETDRTKKRLFLSILNDQKYELGDIRTDFFDFCLSKINSEHEPCCIRARCIDIASKMCQLYPDLAAELEQHLDMMTHQSLSPGLKSVFRRTIDKIGRLKK